MNRQEVHGEGAGKKVVVVTQRLVYIGVAAGSSVLGRVRSSGEDLGS
jgi:hypothetical protein